MLRQTCAWSLVACCLLLPTPQGSLAAPMPVPTQPSAQGAIALPELRTPVVRFTRGCAAALLAGADCARDAALGIPGDWQASVSLYHEGLARTVGSGAGPALDLALEDAVAAAFEGASPDMPSLPATARIRVVLALAGIEQGAIIEYAGRGEELIGDLVALRDLDRELVQRTVQAGKDYLLRIKHPELHGFSKKFDLARGGFDDRLRTIYTSSSLYTLLKLNAFAPDPEVERTLRPIAEFILSMQKPDAPYAGAFYYSLDLNSGEQERRFPVGTTAKIIMTLVALDQRYDDPRYLAAAERAGDWLLAMQRADGSLPVDAAWRKGQWDVNEEFSLFYNCQVLTGLSRLYLASGQRKYYDGAAKIAALFMRMIAADGHLLRDEYRPKVESISTSWLAMALLDFSRIDGVADPALDPQVVETAAFRCMDEVLGLQLTDPTDIDNYGRYRDTSTTSGNGWINEVAGEIHDACRRLNRRDCDKYRTALILTTRWLIQNTYSAANTYHIPDPQRVIGGQIRNRKEQSVRTDAVCHGVNSMLALLQSAQSERFLALGQAGQ